MGLAYLSVSTVRPEGIHIVLTPQVVSTVADQKAALLADAGNAVCLRQIVRARMSMLGIFYMCPQ